jgi:hypothetical protein
MRAWSRLLQCVLLALLILAGCRAAPVPESPPKPAPTTLAQAESLRQSGVAWTNEEIRVHYNRVVSTIGPANEQWKREGMTAEERARRASAIRHEARLTCRAMMSSATEVELLRRRDQEKYGNPDGPTFEQLVESGRKKGLDGDALYESIVVSAQRTDEAVNAAFGIRRSP